MHRAVWFGAGLAVAGIAAGLFGSQQYRRLNERLNTLEQQVRPISARTAREQRGETLGEFVEIQMGRNARLRTPEGFLIRLDIAEVQQDTLVRLVGRIGNPMALTGRDANLLFTASDRADTALSSDSGMRRATVRLGDFAPGAVVPFDIVLPRPAALPGLARDDRRVRVTAMVGTQGFVSPTQGPAERGI